MSEVDKQLQAEEERRKNREKFPEMTKVIDEFRAVFGAGVKVMYVKEGDFEMGTPSPAGVPISEGSFDVVSRTGGKKTRGTTRKVGGVRRGFRH
jgi:hypothetical protein